MQGLLGMEQQRKLMVSDTFTRVNSDLTLGNAETGQVWVALTATWGINSNKAKLAVSSGSYDWAYIESGLSDCKVSVVFTDISVASGNNRLIFRLTDGSNLFFVQNEAARYALYRRQGGNTLLGTYDAVPVAGDTVKAQLIGQDISVYINNTLQISVADSFNQTATKHGIGTVGNTGARWDGFLIEKV